ncbi:MAG: MOSC domain-containing protein [Proteobacteria bacterium]|jgi:MOSC domain-containing protein YiiM|nr:MOSC domain-containing protein [Pseudomonadota bacterium]
MKVIAINIGKPEVITDLDDGDSYSTGINKRPVNSASVNELGLQDDAILNTRFHGGPDQAVYLYRQEDYNHWTRELGRTIAPGTFGENLTLSGLPDDLAVGDELSFPDLRLQVTAPRIPCNTLAARMGNKLFPKKFIKHGQSGHYCRVLQTGRIKVNDPFKIVPYDGPRLANTRFFRDWLARSRLTAQEIEQYLAIPIDVRSRAVLQDLLARQRT